MSYVKAVIIASDYRGERAEAFLTRQGFSSVIHGTTYIYPPSCSAQKTSVTLSFETALKSGYPFIVTAPINSIEYEETFQLLNSLDASGYNLCEFEFLFLGIDKSRFNREWCAFYHDYSMDWYFEAAENDLSMSIFWQYDSPFYKMFKLLDKTSIVELSCGRGRHVPRYIDSAEHITLVDVSEKNIALCSERFSNMKNIRYVVNNGFDLSELEDSSFTSIFSYDSMVHFELFDVDSYLRESFRILSPGGMGLFHHSNDGRSGLIHFDPCNNNHARSFMTKEVFQYLADRAGFDVLEQIVLDWGEAPQNRCPSLDCISLVLKRN